MRYAVAVSGGVDSLFTVLSLKDKGYNVVGIFGIFHRGFLKIKDHVVSKYKELGVDCIFFHVEEEFEEKIINKFVELYLKGQTPNPCCLCNKYIKFGIFKEKILNLGFDFFYTGHYARLIDKKNKKSLFKGIDDKKDQSYFLSLVPLEQFEKVDFLLGGYKKEDVLDNVKKRGISPPIPGESQEVCFIKDDYRIFLKERGVDLPGPGKIISVWGEVLGTHKGLFNYTIGQRRGLGIPYNEPLYVVDKIVNENILVIGTKEDLLRSSCIVEQMNYLEDISNWPKEVEVKVNYNMKPKRATWNTLNNNEIVVHFFEKIPRPTPGQICCIYNKDQVLGGGIIKHESS